MHYGVKFKEQNLFKTLYTYSPTKILREVAVTKRTVNRWEKDQVSLTALMEGKDKQEASNRQLQKQKTNSIYTRNMSLKSKTTQISPNKNNPCK